MTSNYLLNDKIGGWRGGGRGGGESGAISVLTSFTLGPGERSIPLSWLGEDAWEES